ncbi:HEAT repeat domain-containing protein [Kitasatospora sp. NPDC015120]|uniref:HEAT repeat domain-containing protein n=1 Tax=Kitasatospora sp. NPDC015120 TaxID=3364023 RepID=UPI0036F48732
MSNHVGELHIHQGSAPEPPPTDTEAAVQAYLQRVREVYRRLNLDVLGPTGQSGEQPLIELRQVFMPQLARIYEKRIPDEVRQLLVSTGELVEADDVAEPQRTLPAGPVLQIIASEAGRRLVVLGDPGAGKSTLSKYLALVLAGALEEVPAEITGLAGLVPVVVELRQYAQAAWRERTIEDFLDHLHRQERMCLPRTVLEELLVNGQALVVFDGLDEIFDAEVRSETARRITAFGAAHPDVRLIVTSRKYGYRSGEFTTTGFTQVMLQNLERTQVESFIRRWYAAAHPEDLNQADRLAQRLLSAVRELRAVADLAGNPMLLTILAAIGLGRTIPRERREVYAHAVEVLISRWDKDAKFLTPQYPANAEAAQALEWLNTSRRLKLLERVARRMQNGTGKPSGTYVQRDELTGIISGYLTEHNISRPAADIAADHVVEHLSTRNFLLAHYGGGIYGFVHRTFLEYLAAADILRRREEEEWSRDELVDVLDARIADPAWHEVLLLTAGKLKQRDVSAFIDRLLQRHRQKEKGRRAPALILAVRTLAEIEEFGNPPISAAGGRELSVTAKSDAVIDALCIALTRLPDLNLTTALPALATFDHFWTGRERYLRWYYADQAEFPGHSASSGSDIASALTQNLDEITRQTLIAWDPGVRSAALRTLVARRPDRPNTYAAIQRAATDPDQSVQITGLYLLARHWAHHPDARATLHRVATGSVGVVRTMATTLLAEHWPDHPGTFAAASDSDPGTRADALRILAAFWRDHPDTHPAVHRATTDPESTVRNVALHMLARFWRDHPDTHPTVQRAVAAPETDLRRTALRALADYWRGHPGTYPTIHRAADDAEGTIRIDALRMLTGYWDDHPDTYPTIHRAAHDAERTIRIEALRMLPTHWHAQPDTHPTVQRAATDPDARICSLAVRLLGVHWPGHPDTRATARAALASADPRVRNAALRTFAESWPDHPGTLSTVQRAITDPDAGIRATALRTLAQSWPDHPDTVPTIQRAATDPDHIARCAALPALAWRAGDSALPLVKAAARTDGSPEVRAIAIRLLATLWPHEPDVPGLIRDLVRGDDEGIRTIAVQALALLE